MYIVKWYWPNGTYTQQNFSNWPTQTTVNTMKAAGIIRADVQFL